jgi:HD-like signal output (HDOD) protein
VASRNRVRGIDEELWFGTYSDAEAEKKAAESVAATVGRVVGAKPFPVAAQRLAEATRDPDCSLVQVVRILERDMALSARVLRLVNSASFALRTPCTSVRHAASLVGTQKLNQLATTAAILDMVDHTSVHASRILEHSAVVGGLCRYLGVHLGLPADELFTCGFLHDIGKLMLLEVEGKRYGELLTEVGEEYDAIHLYERDLFGFDHALLAGHVLSRWSIPDPVPKVVAWHHHVTRAYEEGPRWASMTSVLRLSDLLSYSLASDDDEVEVERAARSESASYLDISAAQLAAIWDELRNLHERSRALFRGEEPPEALPQVSLRPAARIGRPSASKGLRHSHPSLRPPTLRGLGGLSGAPSSGGGRSLRLAAPTTVQIKEVPEGPKQFPCVVCKGPSFANVCQACHGYVCPDHQCGPDEWCELCRGEYATETYGIRLRPILILMLAAGIGATLVGVLASAASGRGIGSTALLVGPLLGTGLAAGLVAIFHRYAHRAWFLRTRSDRSAASPAHVSTPLPPGMAGEKLSDSGVRESTRPVEVQRLESIFAQASSDDVRIRSEAPPSVRARALSSAPTVGDAGPTFSARVFSSGAPVARDARESVPARAVSSRASAPASAERQVASLIPARSIAVVSPTTSLQPASLAPVAESLPPASLAPAATVSLAPNPHGSLPPADGASAFPPEESSREAAERGRTLRLLSEHSAGSNPPGSQRSAAAVSAAPSLSPQISVRPVVDSDARTLHFPDWSAPPPAREEPVGVSHAVASAAAEPAPPTAPVRTNTAVRQTEAWSLVLQATGTADGW